MFSSHRTLYTDGQASIPKLAEKLTLELVHHIEVALPRITLTQCHFCFTLASTLTVVLFSPPEIPASAGGASGGETGADTRRAGEVRQRAAT